MFDVENPKYDWKVRSDAETLIRARQIQNDPNRLKLAQECISSELKSTIDALEGKPRIPSRNYNSATIKKL